MEFDLVQQEGLMFFVIVLIIIDLNSKINKETKFMKDIKLNKMLLISFWEKVITTKYYQYLD